MFRSNIGSVKISEPGNRDEKLRYSTICLKL